LHLRHLHLLHLLHLHWVHTTGTTHHLRVWRSGAAVHALTHHLLLHLLHLHWVHAAHCGHGVAWHATACLLLSKGLLHGLEVLLHTLPILGHHGRRHRTVPALGLHIASAVIEAASSSSPLTTIAAIVELVELIAATKFLAAITAIIIAHVAAGLGALDFDLLAEDLQRTTQSGVYSCIAVEGDETKPTGSASLFIHHQRGINDSAKLFKEVREIFLSRFLADTADEDLARPLLLLTGNSPLWVNLVQVSR
jgi:hypothetical protein